MMVRYIGIDPGKKGAFVVIEKPNVYIHNLFPIENFIIKLKELMSNGGGLFVAIERQQPFPKQGVVSTFSIGETYGMIKGILKNNGITFVEVSPKSWKRAYGLKNNKQESISIAKENVAKHGLILNKEIETHDEAEALLLALYIMKK